MHPRDNKPEINLNFDDPAVEKLLHFIKHLSKEFKDEPNLPVTIKVLECLIFIKINSPWIRYAVENKEKDSSIYKYATDKDKRVLRAHNDMSFHIISYNDAEQAISDYNNIITSIENRIDELIENPLYAKVFIRKIQDSDVGCMEQRLSPALNFIVSPTIFKLDDLFQDFFAEVDKLRLKPTDINGFVLELINYFDSKLGEPVTHDGRVFDLSWSEVKEYLEKNYGYDEEIKPLNLFKDALVIQERDWHLLNFPTKAIAEQYLRLVKLLLPNDLYREAKKANIVEESKDGNIYYRFRLTKEQFSVVALFINDEANDLTVIQGITSLTSQLKTAIIKNDINEVMTLVYLHPVLKHFPIDNGDTLLISAVAQGSAELVKQTLSIPGIDFNQRRPNGESILFIAVNKKDIEKIKLLLALPDIDLAAKRNSDGKTALQLAKDNGHHDIAKLIEEKQQEQINQLEIETSALRKDHSFESYALTLRRIPDEALYLTYLKELKILSGDKRSHRPTTQIETEHVEARKLWTDVVSETDAANQKYSSDHLIKGQVIQRLISLGEANPEQLYENCIAYIRENSVITFTFKSLFLKNGLTNFQLLNMWEKDNRNRPDYTSIRDKTEQGLFKFLSDRLKKALFASKHARPRYGALLLLDRNTPVRGTSYYGKSFIIFKDVVKLNAIFSPADSANYKFLRDKDYKVCTIHHLEFLLWQCHLETLKAIVARVKSGTLQSATFDQNRGNAETSGYLEVLLPAINIFDPNLVEHIHIDSNDYKMSQEEIEAIQGLGISITNSSGTPYAELGKQFMEAIEKDNVETVIELLNKYPSLTKISDRRGSPPIHIAAQHGSIRTLKIFAERGFDFAVYSSVQIINESADSWTALHSACKAGHVEIVRYLLENGASVNVTNRDGFTPLHLAAFNQHQEVIDILLPCNAGLLAKNNQNQRADDLINTNKNGFKNIIKERKKELLSALIKGDIEIVRKFGNQNVGWLALPLDDRKYTALHVVIAANNLALIKILVEVFKINIDQKIDNPASSEHGATAVYLASSFKNISDDVLQYLIKQGADVGIATDNGRTPLSSAAYNNMPERVKIISEAKNPNPNQITTKHHHSALIHAVERSNAEAVNAILTIPGIDIDHQRHNGDSAITIAAKNGNSDKVKLLLFAYAKNNLRDDACAINLKKALVIADSQGYADIAYEISKIYLPFYVHQTEKRPQERYQCWVSIFGIFSEYQSGRELAAAHVLEQQVNNDYDYDQNAMSQFKDELTNGELGLIRRSLKIKLA